jgi:gas vesicle protein
MGNKAILGLLAGAGAGFLAAILFAPAGGSETRKKIAESMDSIADSIKEAFSEFVDEVGGFYSGLEEKAENMKGRRSSILESLRNEVISIKKEADSLRDALS